MKPVHQKVWNNPSVSVPRSSFDRSHGYKTTFNVGQLIPFMIDEVIPGDTFKVRTNGFARLSTPIYPIMDNLTMETFYFFVPMRLVWDSTEKFFGEDSVGGDGTAPVKPFTSTTQVQLEGDTVAAYFGIDAVAGVAHDELPHRAYWLIYNEWFRDQNLQEKSSFSTSDQPTTGIADRKPAIRNKRHDYFTSCLPWPQKSNQINIPIFSTTVEQDIGAFWYKDTGGNEFAMARNGSDLVTNPNQPAGNPNVVPNFDVWNDNGVGVVEMRAAIAIQQYFEKDARGGTRYPEVMRAHFGVVSPDGRLQRPEFLGGGSSRINITPVAATFEDPQAQAPKRTVGDLGAMGTSSFTGHGFVKSFTEHGFILGIVNVRGDVTYQQGLNRMFDRKIRFDYAWPDFANVSEQAVYTKELWPTLEDDTVFGYQERYAEYRYKPSEVTGKFRSNVPGTLDAWHLSQQFTQEPRLNSNFIQDGTPMDRVLAVTDEPHLIADFYHNVTATRPLPMFGIPGLRRF